jgi:hypothetical protein
MLGESVATVSHHLQILHGARLVARERKGRFAEYSLPAGVFRGATSPQDDACLDLGCCRLAFANDCRSPTIPELAANRDTAYRLVTIRKNGARTVLATGIPEPRATVMREMLKAEKSAAMQIVIEPE